MTAKRTEVLVGTAQAASELGVSERMIRRLARQGEIAASKQAGRWRFSKAALLEWSKAPPRSPAAVEAGGQEPAASRGRQDGGTLAGRQAGNDAMAVVGLGASAGGLEALEKFFERVPRDGMTCYVVVQHQDPSRKTLLPELLQRVTSLTVVQIQDGQKLEPDRIFVSPPDRDLSILHGVLHLLDPVAPRGLRLPIDFFFRSLAADMGARSIGVVLSGMGSDGTLGLGAIKERGGAVFVQSPDTAGFDGMPGSAIGAGFADVVAPAEELARRIAAFSTVATKLAEPAPALEAKTQNAIDKVCVLLRNQTGRDFTLYKRTTVHRRIERRMSLHQIDSFDRYVRFIQENPQEIGLLFKELLIGVTSFFRDPGTWEHLAAQALPDLLAQKPPGAVFRAWVPGCSTGEEAYSLAMIVDEALARQQSPKRSPIQIFATDLDEDAIERARRGLYPPNIASDVTESRLKRYFLESKRGYRVRPDLREAVVFATQDVLTDPPFTKLDLLCCRNLLIYLAPALQKTLLPLFHYSLRPGGILVLGSSESIGAATDLFVPIGDKERTFRRRGTSLGPDRIEFPTSFQVPPARARAPTNLPHNPENLQALAEAHLLRRHTPAAVVTNTGGDILFVSGRTGKYLEPAAGKANWNIHAMAREGLGAGLGAAYRRVKRTRKLVTRRVEILDAEQVLSVELRVERLDEPEALRDLVVVVFADVTSPRRAGPARKRGKPEPAASRIGRELEQVQAELQTTREDMQRSQEELKSANEELQSTNEELQSTNEELTTSKEEMQSLNEELQTVNNELQAKVDELTRANDDLRNLLNSTDIATLFLDSEMRVRRFTSRMTELFNLLPGDLERPITDLASSLVYPDLAADAQVVLDTLVFKETRVPTTDARWYTVRIMPYRTLDNRIDGLVLTFIDATAAKQLGDQNEAGRAE